MSAAGPEQARAICTLCNAEAITSADSTLGKCHSCGGILRRIEPSPADRVRAALRGQVEAHALFDALEIALEALEQYDLFSPLWAGQPTRASVAIGRMADVLEGK